LLSRRWGAFWGVRVEDVSLRTYLGGWYFGGAPPSSGSGGVGQLPTGPGSASGGTAVPALHAQWVEQCVGFGCGQCHGASVAAPPPEPPSYERKTPMRRQASGLVFWALVLLTGALLVAALSGSTGAAGGGRAAAGGRGKGEGVELSNPRLSERAPLRPAPLAQR